MKFKSLLFLLVSWTIHAYEKVEIIKCPVLELKAGSVGYFSKPNSIEVRSHFPAPGVSLYSDNINSLKTFNRTGMALLNENPSSDGYYETRSLTCYVQLVGSSSSDAVITTSTFNQIFKKSRWCKQFSESEKSAGFYCKIVTTQ